MLRRIARDARAAAVTLGILAAAAPALPGAPGAGSSLAAVGAIEFAPARELSGLVKSRTHPGVFWTHNDSGDLPRLYAVRADGSPAAPPGAPSRLGVHVTGAAHVDWEDIAADDRGNLLVGDIGNNGSRRRDLALYVVPEPEPGAAATAPATRIPVYYPDQTAFPGRQRDFDAEALFWARDRVYVITKRWGDPSARLYRLESMDPARPNPLVRIGTYEVGGPVTGADASPDGRRLAVLTYAGLWLFEAEGGGDAYFAGPARWLPLLAGQCESVAFDGERLIVGNEAGELYQAPLEAFTPVER
ncbi:MAG: hypothetical protein ACYDA8_09700 [Deferrisomatales bacterium]